MNTRVTLTKHYLKDGRITLHLSFYPYFYDRRTRKTIKSENLQLFLYGHPKTKVEKNHNEEVMDIAKAILCKRTIQVRNEDYGFVDKTTKNEDFLKYFDECAKKKHSKWHGCYEHFRRFCGGTCTVGMVNVDLCKRFREYLATDATNGRTNRPLSANSASGYMASFRALLRQAYIDKLLETNLNDFFEGIAPKKVHKEALTIEEFQRLINTPCNSDVLKRISAFAVFTGLRVSDLSTLTWDMIQKSPDGGWAIVKKIQKTQQTESIPVSDEALTWCGDRSAGLVFKGFRKTMTCYSFKKWLADAGITKPITFHCLRHTTATLMITNGVDLYTVSKMLTHSDVHTTQIYADVVDMKRRAAANSISLRNDNEMQQKQ